MLKKAEFVDRISESLSILEVYIKNQNAIGKFDINKECEDFFCEFLNIVFDLQLMNQNELEMNFPAVDLGDKESRVCYQVTSTNDRKKIKYTLEKFKEKKLYEDYEEVNIFILGRKSKYKKGKDLEYDEFDFDIKENVLGFEELFKIISKIKNIDKLEEIYKMIQKNLIRVHMIKGKSYLDNIEEYEVKLGEYDTFLSEYCDLNSDEGKYTKKLINVFAKELTKLDKNTREVMLAIIIIRKKGKKKKPGANNIYYNYIELKKYLKIDKKTLEEEIELLVDKGFISLKDEGWDEYDELYFYNDGWNVLYDIVEFCDQYKVEVSKIILNLDFTVLN